MVMRCVTKRRVLFVATITTYEKQTSFNVQMNQFYRFYLLIFKVHYIELLHGK